MKKILMVAFHYPPCHGSSGLQRTLAFSRHLPENGWRPIVLTAHPRAYPQIRQEQLADVPPDLTVKRAFVLDTGRHLSIRQTHFKWMAVPDRWVSWWLGAVPAGLRLIRQHRPDLLWSTHPLATAHLIGATLHRLSGIPWVADFRDPMLERDPVTGEEYPFDPRTRRAYGWIERLTISRCARAVFTTPGTAAIFAQRYPDVSPRRWAIIANGYDEDSFAAAEQLAPPRDPGPRPLVLLHSGTLYAHARDPRPFFTAVAALRRAGRISPANLKIVLRATGDDAYYRGCLREAGVDDIVTLEPPLAYREALAEMLSADGLLLFQASNSNMQIPAKLYEYLRARRPIFALTDAGGDTAHVLREAGIDTIAPLDSAEMIAKRLDDFLPRLRDPRVALPDETAVRRHSRKARTKELAALLSSITLR
ncbi:MAG: glycosyltransferase [Candidatus Rokuibacteriota bacterium]